MPRSIIIYSSKEDFLELESLLNGQFSSFSIQPYTLSFPQRNQSGLRRVRITELSDDVVVPLITDRAKAKGWMVAASTDGDVTERSYEEIAEEADRFRRSVTLQFTSPVIVECGGQKMPFPEASRILAGYAFVWDAFSASAIGPIEDAMASVEVTNFKISSAATAFGLGAEGWMTLELREGATEEGIGTLNRLVDFAFYCGTGLYTNHGLGQTRRIEGMGAGSTRAHRGG
jgi:CRISPR-associated endoribonuclease Cas6